MRWRRGYRQYIFLTGNHGHHHVREPRSDRHPCAWLLVSLDSLVCPLSCVLARLMCVAPCELTTYTGGDPRLVSCVPPTRLKYSHISHSVTQQITPHLAPPHRAWHSSRPPPHTAAACSAWTRYPSCTTLSGIASVSAESRTSQRCRKSCYLDYRGTPRQAEMGTAA